MAFAIGGGGVVGKGGKAGRGGKTGRQPSPPRPESRRFVFLFREMAGVFREGRPPASASASRVALVLVVCVWGGGGAGRLWRGCDGFARMCGLCIYTKLQISIIFFFWRACAGCLSQNSK